MTITVVQVLPALEVGGVEQGTLEVARELVRRGHRALVIARGGRMVSAIEAAGAEFIPWPIGRKSILTLRLVPRLRALLHEHRVDILHARSRVPAWIAYLAWRGMPTSGRPRFVTTVHGPYGVNAYSAIMTRGERVIAISRTIRDYILTNYRGVQAERIRLIYRGVDPSTYPYGFRPDESWLSAWAAEMPQLQGQFVVTLPARITRWKGQEDFIALVARLKLIGVPVHGLIVGGAEPRRAGFLRELQSRIVALGLQDSMSFAGQRADLREILAVSDVVVSLAREPEAFGRTTLEALALGRPVVGYDHGGVGEILEAMFPEGRVTAGDVDTAAERIAAFHGAPPIVPPRSIFTLARMLDETLAVYAELTG